MSEFVTLDDILARSCSASGRPVELKSWGGTIKVRPMRPREADAYLATRDDDKLFESQVQVVFDCVENPKFESVDQVANLGVGMVSDAFWEIYALSGFGDGDKDVKKNSPVTTDDDSLTD